MREDMVGAIEAVRSEFTVTTARNNQELRAAFRLRYQVYCQERGYEPGVDGEESDRYDQWSRHILLRDLASGELLGTARIVLPSARDRQMQFPLQEVCAPGLLSHLPRGSSGEISRFAISKERRSNVGQTAGLMRLALLKGLIRLSREEGVTHWCAILERSLLRLWRASGMHLDHLGPMIEHHGLRQPASCQLRPMLQRMRDEQPLIWQFLTDEASDDYPQRSRSWSTEQFASA